MNWTEKEKQTFALVDENTRMVSIEEEEAKRILHLAGLGEYYCPGSDYYLWKNADTGIVYLWPYGWDEPVCVVK